MTHFHDFLSDGHRSLPCQCGAVIDIDGNVTDPHLYGCVVTRNGSQEWQSGTLPGIVAWLSEQDFTEAVIQPIPAATIARLGLQPGLTGQEGT